MIKDTITTYELEEDTQVTVSGQSWCVALGMKNSLGNEELWIHFLPSFLPELRELVSLLEQIEPFDGGDL